jgi:hypothetical protein
MQPATAHTPASQIDRDAQALTRVPSRWQRIRPALVLAGVVLVGSVALHVRDPHQQGSWGLCPWLLLTGTYCPGCGGLRAVNDLTHGQVLAAASSNLLLVGTVPVAAVAWARSLRQRWLGVRRHWPPARVNVAWTVAVLAVLVFWVVRNLPLDAVGWLQP